MNTHEVVNQAPPLVDHNPLLLNRVLTEAMGREGAEWALPMLERLGARCGSAEVQKWGALANENPPVLRSHDRYGQRIDEVEFHPASHELMRLSISFGAHNLPWQAERSGAHVARAALLALLSEVDFGHGCPISMTYAAVPALRSAPRLIAEWLPRICSTDYDSRLVPAQQKRGALIGMAMTEKQGGSDVRANTTRAVADGSAYRLTGHKWFCSAPMSDAFLVLAQADKGLSCFFLPRFTPDGARNRFFIQRLKNKLGNRSNASSEVEFENAYAELVGEAGRGVATIVEMVNHTRLDCVIGSAAMMRQALVLTLHHARHREAFGKLLSAQPLMQNVLADLALESEAATLLMVRLARAFDRRGQDPKEAAFARIATAIAKFYVCKRAVAHAFEALECLGGNGYTEDFPLARIYRETPLNSIWEGSGNVMCLDVLRAARREAGALEALFAELTLARGGNSKFDAALATLKQSWQGDVAESQARVLVENMAIALQAALLIRHSPTQVADAFCSSRLAPHYLVGTLPASVNCAPLLERALPL